MGRPILAAAAFQAAKTRVTDFPFRQRQQAAHQRAWYRAFTELRRQREREEDGDFEPAGAPAEPVQPEAPELPERTQLPTPKTTKDWPPIDEKTGKPRYFVG